MFISTLAFWLIGYGLSRNAQGGFIGEGFILDFELTEERIPDFLYTLCFCQTACTIVSGSMAERTRNDTYAFFTFFMAALIYPVISAWCWGDGWLSRLGYQDHGGSGVVHLTGGVCGFVGAVLLGPRIGYFKNMN
jgi:ammonium transporter, Amt family